jgi:hypothetical protein
MKNTSKPANTNPANALARMRTHARLGEKNKWRVFIGV